jgi:hypothetical protein
MYSLLPGMLTVMIAMRVQGNMGIAYIVANFGGKLQDLRGIFFFECFG